MFKAPVSVNEVHDFFAAHYTARKYKNYTLPKDHLDCILFAAQRAPTDATAQMYSIIHLQDMELKKQMAEWTGNPHIATASEAFVFCADLYRLKMILKTKNFDIGSTPHIGIHFGIGDAVMAGENLLLAAEMLGYHGCWIGGVLNEIEKISQALKLPELCFPFAAMTIGLSDESPKIRPRLSRKHIVHTNNYQDYNESDLKKDIEHMGAITARGDWAETLARYFAKDGGMSKREPELQKLLEKTFFSILQKN